MPKDDRFEFRVSGDEKELYDKAAAVEDLPTAMWARRVLKREATKVTATVEVVDGKKKRKRI